MKMEMAMHSQQDQMSKNPVPDKPHMVRPVGRLIQFPFFATALLIMGIIGTTSSLLTSCSSEEEALDNISLWGMVEKGPFLADSQVTITARSKSGEVVGELVQSQVQNNLGYYAAKLPTKTGAEAEYILIEVEGKFFNELLGAQTNGEHTLKAVVAIPSEQKEMGGELQANVNVITHMTHLRVIKLIEDEGKAAQAAVTQAEAELREAVPEIPHPEGEQAGLSRVTSITGGDKPDNGWLLALSCVMGQIGDRAEGTIMSALDLFAEELEYDGTFSGEGLTGHVEDAIRFMDSVSCRDNLVSFFEEVLQANMIPDISEILDTDRDGTVNADDDDMDGDEVPNDEDCAPGDYRRWILLDDGVTCVADSNDLDGDGVANDDDCAPLDGDRYVVLDNEACVTDGPDWDGDGVLNNEDCAPKDPAKYYMLVDGVTCVGDSDDWDGDGVSNDEDCAPLDPSLQILVGDESVKTCVGDSDDWDGDGVPNEEDCAPTDPDLQLQLDDGSTCVAEGTDDLDMDGEPNALDCGPTDNRINPDMGEVADGLDNNCDERIDEGWCGEGDPLSQASSSVMWCSEPQDGPMMSCEGSGCQYSYVANMNYAEAVAACAAHVGFSLPTLQQFRDILGSCEIDSQTEQESCTGCSDSGTCSALFGESGGGVEMYWTSTDSTQAGAVMAVDIGAGQVFTQVKEGNAKVRCVQ